MTESRRDYTHLSIEPSLKIGPDGPIPYRPATCYESSAAESEPPQSTDTPGIRLDDLLELEHRNERTDGAWTLVHSQLSRWGPKRETVITAFIIRRVSDRSLWVAKPELGECAWGATDGLIPLTLVHAVETITTAYVIWSAQGTTGTVCAIEQPLTADLLEISSETVGD